MTEHEPETGDDGAPPSSSPRAPSTAAPATAKAAPAASKPPSPAAPGGPSRSLLERWMIPESRSRRLLIGLAIYLACLIVYALMAGDRLAKHTPFNHYALLADAWLHGRHHLLGNPPSYAGMNDFALFDAKWHISFPPFPAVLMMPLVWLSGSPENFRDGQFIVWLAGIGPAVLFLVLEKLRRTQRSERSEVDNVRLALLFAFGTVYFFSAVQGTVWFAAHVVGVGLAALFVLFALDAERPALAGAMLGCMFLTRTTTTLVGVFFAFEALRVAYARAGRSLDEAPRALPTEGTLLERAAAMVKGADRAALTRLVVAFSIPVLVALAFASWLNNARFGNPAPWAFGHEYLQVGWKTRIDRWGLFSFHFLPRNLAVMLGSLPWRPLPTEPKVALELLGMTFHVPHYVISGHGLALWWTTPVYLWLVRPKKVDFLWAAAAVAALGPCVMNLLYQNSGWFQFGYRFSNDYAIFLFVLLALSARRLSRAFWIAATWAVLWNTFGAASFERAKYDAFYSHEAAVPTRRYGGTATSDLVFPPD
ncbi:MAG: DUF2029 domain-containing protein [Labilithrix sp.]|nr:DUF2029 domain-containing protein [Labilithrix sp.]